MLYVIFALIIGIVFGLLGSGVIWLSRRRFSPAVWIIGLASFIASFLISLALTLFSQPVVGSIILVCLLAGGLVIIIFSRLYSRSFGRIGKSLTGVATLVIAGGLLFSSAYFGLSTAIWQTYDQAKYFDSILQFPTTKMPFNSLITGKNVRVVDGDLAAEIIQKSNPYGSNSMILELHVGKINGELMWIGVMGTDAIQIGRDNAGRKRNSIFGFVGVDLTDPTKEVVVIEQTFEIGHYLARQKTLERIIWKINPNYCAGDNSYFSMDNGGIMRLLVPYSIMQNWKFEGDLAMTTYLQKLGGVLEFASDGRLINDYTDLSELPDYARIQCYPENWLESSINKWGRHRKGNHEFAYWFTTTEQLGISWFDDVRVIYDSNTQETSQYVMLTQPESQSQLLRGAIKANATGIFFFDWADLSPKPIDTYNALAHCETAVDLKMGTTNHDYHPILPLLYPIRNIHQNITDYAYVVPIQLGSIRFGGISITNPFDPSGIKTIVEFAEVGDTVDFILVKAIDSYLTLLGETQPTQDNFTAILEINQFTSFEQGGNTIYVAYGNLTYILEGNITPTSINTTVWFTQGHLNVSQWQIVIFLQVGDVLELNVMKINEIFYCIKIASVS